MTIVHNAFGFDYASFERALKRPFADAAEGDPSRINAFALANRPRLTNPDTHSPLEEPDLLRALHDEDSIFIAEVCMSAFYDPSQNAGLGLGFSQLDRALDNLGHSEVLFGTTGSTAHLLADLGMSTSCVFSAYEIARIEWRLRGAARGFSASDRAKLARLIEAGRSAGGLYVALDFVEIPGFTLHASHTGALA